MTFIATIVQIHSATTAQLIAPGQQPGAALPVNVRVSNIGATGPVNIGGASVNASVGVPWNVSEGPFTLTIGAGGGLYAAAVASTHIGIVGG